MKYKYIPQNVCSTQMNFEIGNNIIKKVEIINGCPGNTKAVSNLLVGMNINEAIKRLKGIPCRNRGTSCPDQIAIALNSIIKGEIKPL